MSAPNKASKRVGITKRYGALVVVLAAMALLFVHDAHKLITLENVVIQRDRFHTLLAEHALLSLLAYIVTYSTAVALSLPGGLVLTVTGGLLFGTLIGGLAAVIAATIGATIVFLIARTAVGDTLAERVGPRLTKLSEGFKEEALSYMLFLRLVPVFPFWFVNIAPALLGVPLKTYVIGTVLGIIPATFAFASAGAGLDSVIMAAKNEYAACVALKGANACKMELHASSLFTKELLLALILLGLVALIPVILKRWRSSHVAAK